jgi:hypothetical protein
MARLAGLLAWCVHVSPKVEWTGRGDAATGRVVGEATADFIGQLRNGRVLVVEAKSRRADDGALYLREVEPQQRSQLDASATAGGLALLAVEFRYGDARPPERFVVPWQEVPWRRRSSAGSLVAEDLTPWSVPGPGRCYLSRFVSMPPLGSGYAP